MIPERVEAVTSAVFNKNKDKVFETPVGKFIYRYIKLLVYFHGVIRNDDYSEPFLIASKEKAVCDTLSKIRSHGEKLDIEMLLLEDMRIDEDILLSLNKDDIDFLAKMRK
jgi:hypothetical protein